MPLNNEEAPHEIAVDFEFEHLPHGGVLTHHFPEWAA